MAKRKPLDKWILEALTDTDKDGPISAISLMHMRGMQPVELHTWKARAGADPKQLAELFQDKARTYCQDLPGVQTFNLWAFYGKTEPEGQMPFTVRVEADLHESGLTTEAPTETGVKQMSMRWAEMLQGQVYRRQQIMDDHSIRMIEQQSRMIESLMSDRFAGAEIIVKMMMEQQANTHKLEMERLTFERATRDRETLMKLAPPLVNSLTGKEVFPQNTADSALLETIVTEMDDEKLEKLMGSIMELGIPDAVMGPLANRIMQIRQKKAQREQAQRQLPVYKGDPADDVKGGAE